MRDIWFLFQKIISGENLQFPNSEFFEHNIEMGCLSQANSNSSYFMKIP